MNKKTRRTLNDGQGVTNGEHHLIGLIPHLVRSDREWIGRRLLKLLRLRWHDRPLQAEAGTEVKRLPNGPFVTSRKKQLGDLLLWVPKTIESFLIDDLTGGYGYSHATIDAGEIDLPTGKPVMEEIVVGQTVARKFQDEYEPRAFARVPLSKTGVNVDQFVARVQSKRGEQYDTWDVLTLGEIVDPAKEVCSGLAADCLPEKERQRMAWARRTGLLRGASASVHSRLGASNTKIFISPNGLAEYYGVPVGRKIAGPDVAIEPHPVEITLKSVAAAAARRRGWTVTTTVAAGAFALALLILALTRYRAGRRPLEQSAGGVNATGCNG